MSRKQKIITALIFFLLAAACVWLMMHAQREVIWVLPAGVATGGAAELFCRICTGSSERFYEYSALFTAICGILLCVLYCSGIITRLGFRTAGRMFFNVMFAGVCFAVTNKGGGIYYKHIELMAAGIICFLLSGVSGSFLAAAEISEKYMFLIVAADEVMAILMAVMLRHYGKMPSD